MAKLRRSSLLALLEPAQLHRNIGDRMRLRHGNLAVQLTDALVDLLYPLADGVAVDGPRRLRPGGGLFLALQQ